MDDAGPGDGGVDSGRDSGTDAGTDAGDMCDGVDCSGMDDECNMGVCNPATGDCEQDPLPSGTGCDDMDACTMDDECDGSGTCGGTDVDCSGMTDMCNTGTCNPATGACGRTPVMDGTTCSDGMMCTGMDRCVGGSCMGTAVDCSGMTDMCNTGTCNPATGACGRTPVMDGTACTDAMACSTGDRCVGGACTPTGSVDCTAMSDTCNVGMCNPADGSCGRAPRPDGTACDDMDACTMPDTCAAGSCAGTRVPTPGDQCPMAIDIPATDGTQMITGNLGACFRSDGASPGGRGCLAGVGAGRDVVYRLVLTETRVVRLETFAVAGSMLDDTVIHIRTNCTDEASEVICDDDGSAGFFSLVNTTLNPGTYFIYLDSFSDMEVGDYRMDVTLSEPETCASAGTIALPATSGATVTVVGNTTGNVNDFTVTPGTCGLASAGTAPDHVYSITVPAGGARYRFETITPPASYDTTLHIRSSPCATGVATPIACDDDGGPGTLSNLEVTLAPGTFFLVVDGFGTSAGVYTLRITRLPGHAVLIGHDYFENEANADRAVGNAVFLANDTVNAVDIVEYRQFADLSAGGEVERTRNAITARATALGRTVAFTTLSDFSMLNLSTADVLLVPEQELTTQAMLQTIATAWNTQLNNFITRGGVIVVLDHNGGLGGTWEILDGTGLLTIPSSRVATGLAVTVTTATDPIAMGVVSGYLALNGSLAFPGATGGTVVLSQGADPLALHLQR